MIIYNLVLNSVNFILKFAKHFNKKINLRENKWLPLLSEIPAKKAGEIRYWFHSASMGEFEQAKPIIEAIKSKNNNIKIICSFFSPSGYENQKKYKYADFMLYFPIDTKKNDLLFIEKVNPNIVVFVRYEIWANCLHLLKCKSIPTYLICASLPIILKKNPQHFLKSYYLNCYSLFDMIYTISNEEFDLFTKIGVTQNIKSSNDTRFDRIIQKVNEFKSTPFFDKSVFIGKTVIIAGSSWEPDEDILLKAYNVLKNKYSIILILVPHEPTQKHIGRLIDTGNEFVLLSQIELLKDSSEVKELVDGNKIILVDSIGKLLKLYANANIAYIGGAFGAGVHSVTEPAGYGLPLICGSGYNNSPDAENLVKINALQSVASADELICILDNLLNNNELLATIGEKSYQYIQEGKGASLEVLKDIFDM